MPAIKLAPDAFINDLEQTANLLVNGFESLLSEVESLARRERDLKSRLDYAYDEVCSKLFAASILSCMMRNQD